MYYRVFIFSLSVKGKPTPLSPVLFAFMFTSINGYIQGRYFTHFLTYDFWWFADPRFMVGHLMFLFGMAANIHSDTILRGLRKPGETAYKIPHGQYKQASGLSKFLSCGENYSFGEFFVLYLEVCVLYSEVALSCLHRRVV